MPRVGGLQRYIYNYIVMTRQFQAGSNINALSCDVNQNLYVGSHDVVTILDAKSLQKKMTFKAQALQLDSFGNFIAVGERSGKSRLVVTIRTSIDLGYSLFEADYCV